jgi:hypothetical protein
MSDGAKSCDTYSADPFRNVTGHDEPLASLPIGSHAIVAETKIAYMAIEVSGFQIENQNLPMQSGERANNALHRPLVEIGPPNFQQAKTCNRFSRIQHRTHLQFLRARTFY